MINLHEYVLNNSIRAGRKLYIPKRYVACFVMRHKGEKASSIFKHFKDTFGANAGHRGGYDSFVDETFELGEVKKVIGLKNQSYEGMTLSNDFPFTNSLLNGLQIIREILGGIDLANITEEALYKVIDIRLWQVKDVCSRNELFNCGIDQNIFDFVIARECLLNQSFKKANEIAQDFYDLLICSELFETLVSNVKPENQEKCIRTLRALSIASYDPRFEFVSIDQLREISVSDLFYFVGTDINILVNVLNYFSENQEDVVPQLMKNYLKTLDKDDFIILSRRENETLDAIGQDYNVTRERIRQIEAKEIEKFNEFYLDNFSSEKKNLLFVFPKISSIFPLNCLKETMGDMNDCFRNLMKSISFAGEAKYYKEIDAIVETDRVYDFFKRTVDEVLSDYFKKADLDEKIYACLDSLDAYGFDEATIRHYIEKNYKEKEATFVKKRFPLTKVKEAEFVLENYFDDGFHFSDEEQIKLMNKYALDEFGAEIFDLDGIDMSNPHTVQAIIERASARLIDRGTYVHSSKAHELPMDLVDKIIAYLKEKNSALAYSDIFETFQSDLIEIGINNRYALQGAMSVYEGELFKGKRDYVLPVEIQQTLRDSINAWILSRPGIFSYDDFKKEFKGVAQSVFMSAIYQVGGIAYYWSQGYVVVDKLNISESDKAKLKQLIEYLIGQYHMEYCSSDEIFNLVNIQMHDFVAGCGMKYSYDLFSVLQILFADDFKFKRPMIGSHDAVFETGNEIVDGYLDSRNTVKLMKLRKYLDVKMSNATEKYITVFEIVKNKWNEFVAIDVDTIVRKETISISEKELVRLDVIIEMLLEQKASLNIEEDIVEKFYFKEIAGMQSNRYLILGLVNTFFHDKYEVSAEGNKYRGGTFFITKK